MPKNSKQIRRRHLSANNRIKAIITLLSGPVKVAENNASKRAGGGHPSLGRSKLMAPREFEATQLAPNKDFESISQLKYSAAGRRASGGFRGWL